MSWLTLTFISAVALAISTLVERVLMQDEQSDPVAYGFIFQIITGTLIFIYAIFTTGFQIPNLTPLIPNLILTGILYALANYTLFKAFQTTQASEVTILSSSRSIWSILTAIIFLKESFNTIQVTGTVLIITGVIAVSWIKKQTWKLSNGHLLSLAAALFLGIAFTNDAYILNNFDNVPSYLVLSFFLPSIVILFFKPKAIFKIKLFLKPKRAFNMLLNCLVYAIATISIFLAYKTGGNISQIAPISQSAIIITITLAYIFLKERDRVLQKILGAILVFVGVLLLK